ncbi:MAG TPA: guanylate kinase [Chromatiaceae bacterium]|nr:guanylate kinase [Chromatiaceae bacterium]HIB83095.1 guanylate kinase [Chromatiaceae bacterium]HIN83203.1 guanylate kinase [Chromatiales bacterium]HIO14739.1 guanylate kinase [Chromatiales bacterium]HIO53624.1 guanylate kinase [Chromatiales bacterium]
MNGNSEQCAGTLYVVSAPSGAGKTSLVAALVESDANIEVSVSHTTRIAREGEVDGEHYHFVDKAAFESMREAGSFLEHAQVFDNFYGTSKIAVERRLAAGKDVILEIDWQGAAQVRAMMRGVVTVFVLPPSRQALEQRLRGRGQDDETVIARRMYDAEAEMSHYAEFDFLVINDVFEDALVDLRALVQAHRLQLAAQQARLAGTIEELLATS